MQTGEVEVDSKGLTLDSGLLSRPEMEKMISWETNNLYDYLRDMYDNKNEDMVGNRCSCCACILNAAQAPAIFNNTCTLQKLSWHHAVKSE